jgi:hypothetical protein
VRETYKNVVKLTKAALKDLVREAVALNLKS